MFRVLETGVPAEAWVEARRTREDMLRAQKGLPSGLGSGVLPPRALGTGDFE